MSELINKAHASVTDLPNWNEPKTVNDVITGPVWTSAWVWMDGANPGVFASPDGRLWVHRDRVVYPPSVRGDDVIHHAMIVRIPGGPSAEIGMWIPRRRYPDIQTRAIKHAVDGGDFDRWRAVQGIFTSRPEWVR